MKNDETFSDDGVPSTSYSEHEVNSNGQAQSSPHNAPEDISTSASLPRVERRRISHHHIRLLQVTMAIVVLVALAGGYGVFRAVSQPSRQTSSAFQQTRCPFVLGAGLVEGKNVTCGFLSVPEDRSLLKSPTIQLAVAIFKSPSSQSAPDPVLFLNGGPGDALLETFGPRLNAGNLAYVLQNRDLILLDQRGTGYSQPSLHCSVNETPSICYHRLVKSGINLNAFTTQENAADVHDLIQALGYQQVNLDGVSYGTRLALTIMRQYPADLRSVILDSVLPPQVISFTSIAPAAQRAFDILFHNCAIDSHCNATYPNLQKVFYQLVADLNHTPITFETTTQTLKSLTVHFTGSNLVLWLRNSLYQAKFIPQLPETIFQIRLHNYTLLSQIYGGLINDTMSWGMFYSVMCGEDGAFTTRQALEQSVRGLPVQAQPALLNSSMSLFSVCQFWGMQPVPETLKGPVKSTIPTLILQGEFDPVTPPTNGMLAARTLSRSYFFLFPGIGHGVIASYVGNCPNDIMNAFLANPGEKPDASCIITMAEPFFT
jgi:pimeloyl-ACP methyl ester carboxylesterase